MDIRQIEFFVAVVDEQGFTRAAEVSHVSQPGLSGSIRTLERELRARLFERSPRGVRLTAAGEAFLPRARHMLDDARAVRQEVLEASGTVTGRLRVGAEQCLGDLVDLPDLLGTFHLTHPDVTLGMVQGGTQSLLENVRRGELDVALIGLPANEASPASGGGVARTLELLADGFELLADPGHPVVTLPEVTLEALAGTTFVDLDVTWGARRIVDAAFSARRLERRSAFTVNDVHMLLDVVRQGLAVALVPASVGGKPQASGLFRIPVDDPALRWSVQVAVGSGSGSAGRLFADMMVPAPAVDEARVVVGGA
ncbi:LysR family transcriptional regulator [Promicromonospora sp. NPDC090134]|uniref:LysR family transcriptional regulator n=1 Tax=Promicromonospora sp. NPDC090134 TaxID=3364408 RepID=UPI003807ADE3